MPLLFSVPQPWFVAFLSEWLDAISLGRIDIAISSRRFRPQFLQCLQEMRSTTVVDIGKGYLTLKEILGFDVPMGPCEWSGWWWQWLSLRRIYVERIELTGRAYNTIWSKAIDSNKLLELPSLRQIKIGGCDVDLGYLVRVSPNIQSLNMDSSTSDEQLSTPDSNITWVSDIGLQCIANAYQHSLKSFTYTRRVWCSYGPASEFSEGCLDYFMRTGRALIDLLRQCSHLQRVKLTGDTLRGIELNELFVFGHLFQELRFEGHDETRLGPSAQVIVTLLMKCVNLKKLMYSGSTMSIMNQRSILTTIAQSCLLLEELQLSSMADSIVFDTTFPQLCQNLKHISKLNLSSCEFTDAIFLSISGMEQLNDLELYNCEGLTDLGISYLARLKLINLVIWEIDYCESYMVHVRPSVLTAEAFQSFRNPEAAISQSLESFRMNIMNIDTLIDDGKLASALSTCHKLKHLHIHWGSRCEFGGQFSEPFSESSLGVVNMINNCPLLEVLFLPMTLHGLMNVFGEHGCTCINLKDATIGINSSHLTIFQEHNGIRFRTLYPHVKLIPFEYHVDGVCGTHEYHEIHPHLLPHPHLEDEGGNDEIQPLQEEDEGDADEEVNNDDEDVNAT